MNIYFKGFYYFQISQKNDRKKEKKEQNTRISFSLIELYPKTESIHTVS